MLVYIHTVYLYVHSTIYLVQVFIDMHPCFNGSYICSPGYNEQLVQLLLAVSYVIIT